VTLKQPSLNPNPLTLLRFLFLKKNLNVRIFRLRKNLTPKRRLQSKPGG